MLAALLLATSSVAGMPAQPAHVQKIVPMDDRRFWDIIERSGPDARDQEGQETRLRTILTALPDAELIAYQAAFDAKRAAAYRWDLWGAAYVIHGGASDDGFDYFRNWLIARGRRTFDAALADPDSLAAVIPEGTSAEFESFGTVALLLWAMRTGRDAPDMPSGGPIQAPEPAGPPFSEDSAILAARYPKLWKRFGEVPLG